MQNKLVNIQNYLTFHSEKMINKLFFGLTKGKKNS